MQTRKTEKANISKKELLCTQTRNEGHVFTKELLEADVMKKIGKDGTGIPRADIASRAPAKKE
jgi:hypothetical protein